MVSSTFVAGIISFVVSTFEALPLKLISISRVTGSVRAKTTTEALGSTTKAVNAAKITRAITAAIINFRARGFFGDLYSFSISAGKKFWVILTSGSTATSETTGCGTGD